MTNREWLIEKVTNDEFLAALCIVDEPTCADDFDWQDRYTNMFDRKYETKLSTFVKNMLGNPAEFEEEVYYKDYGECLKDVLVWLNAEHKQETEE